VKRLSIPKRTLGLLIVIAPLLALFIYVGLRSGPLAPVAVAVAGVESRALAPSLFGIGTVEARYTYKIGPTFAGRLQRLDVDVGEQVKAGQLLGEMDPVDLDDRVRAQEAAFRRAEATLREAQARHSYAQTQANRYEQLFAARLTSEESLTSRRQELQIADAALSAAREEITRTQSEHAALVAQRNSLRLVSPVDGVITARRADPGTTVVAGESVVEVINPGSLWINVRFDQISATGLATGLPAHIALRSHNGQVLQGHVLRVEPVADTVTEEILAKVAFSQQPERVPPVGELAEVTLDMPPLPAGPVVPNAALQRQGDKVGVWHIVDGDLYFTPIKLGAYDLDGHVQVLGGVGEGDTIVVYSEKSLTARSRIKVLETIPGVSR
jgi:RND family efflux transporter MFP subunit